MKVQEKQIFCHLPINITSMLLSLDIIIFCRSVFSQYERDSSVNGIKSWRYVVPGSIFQSPINNENNKCFCDNPGLIFCQHDGALLVSPCLYSKFPKYFTVQFIAKSFLYNTLKVVMLR